MDKDFKVNIEVNHATLAGHTFEHELAVAVDNGMLGSIDANRGDYQNGWDTDQFPIDNYELTQAMMQIIRNGGLGNGGTNFDAKTRRNSTDLEDIFIAHIAGMVEKPGGDMLPACLAGAFPTLQVGIFLHHVGVKIVLPLRQIRPVAYDFFGAQAVVVCQRNESQMQVGCFLVHVYHGRHDIFPAYPPDEEVCRPLEKRLYLL